MFLTWQFVSNEILPIVHEPDTNTKQRTHVRNLKPVICHGICEGNGRGQEGVGMWHSLHAPLAEAGMPEEVCESELI